MSNPTEKPDVTAIDLMKYLVWITEEQQRKGVSADFFSKTQTVVSALVNLIAPAPELEKQEIEQVICLVSDWKRNRTLKTYYVWKELSNDDEGNPFLVTPHANPMQYEDPFDYWSDSPEAAKECLINFNGESGWVLCRETLESLEPPMPDDEFEALGKNYGRT